jgi:hypothetical protein
VDTDQAYIGEIAEAQARGSVAEVYADIRVVLGAPVVAYVYRALAIEPGRLERICAELRPNLTSRYVRGAAGELATTALGGIVPIPASAMRVTGFDAARTFATVEAFRRVNCSNVLAVHALLAGVDGGGSAGEAGEWAAPELGPILPTLDPATLPLSVRVLLEEFSAPVTGDERPLLIPSLLRALAYDPATLALLWSALRPALTSSAFAAEVERTRARAEALAADFPYP